jgi:asparagine synthase (glutamine-hydrolysing)
MCGIVGYFKAKGNVQDFDLTRAAAMISHRGPDGNSFIKGKSFHVAFNRLAINDLSDSAMQPFRQDGITAYMNGEIYNHLELKKRYQGEFVPRTTSDSEILPFLYKKQGMKFLNSINGMFAVVIIDENNDRNYLVLDRFGVKPMYYTLRDGILFFASEMKALLRLIDFELDKRNINVSFNIINFPYPYSPFKDMYKISPGSFIEYQNGKIEEKRWYFLVPEKVDNNREYIQKRFDYLFDQAITYRLRSDVPVGSFLSGGLDSSSIAVAAADKYRQYNKDFHVFNGVIEGKEGLSDNINAQRLAKEKGFTYHEIKIDRKFYENNMVACAANFDEILFEAGCINFYAVNQQAHKYVTVMLDGIGGDELFMGYVKYLWFKRLPLRLVDRLNKFMPQSQKIRRFMTNISRRKGSKLYDLLADKMLLFAHLMEYVPAGFFGDDSNYDDGFLCDTLKKHEAICRAAIDNDFSNMLGYLDFFYLTGLQNVFADRTGMAYSIEGRNPYQDYQLVEFAFGIDSDLKIDKTVTKKLFRQLHSRRLPDYILQAPKMGFSSPLQKWLFNSPLQKPYQQYIENNKGLIVDIIGDYAYKKVMDSRIFNRSTASMWHVFMAYILWHKINVAKINLNNANITLYDFFNNY